MVRRTDNGEIGLTAAAWLEDRTTTTYQPSHLRAAASAAARRVDVGPSQRMFAPGNLAPAMAGAASARASYAPAPAARLTLPTRALDVNDNPFARPRSAVGASFWNALAFAGLFASVLIGRVIVQAGQEGAHAATQRAAATQPAPTQGPTHGAGPQNSGAGGVGVNALAPSADSERQQQPAAASETQAAAASGTQVTASDSPAVAARETQTTARGAPPMAAAAGRGRHAEGRRGYGSRGRSEALDWRRETPAAEAAPLPAAKPAVVDPSAALGTLRLNSRPWSQVFIDGRLIGNTPQLGLRLPAGRYTVRMANPELGMTKTIIVNVPAGELVSRVETLE